MSDESWIDVGAAAELAGVALQQVMLGDRPIALSCENGTFGAIAGTCNHVGGPLGEGFGERAAGTG